MTKSDIQRIEEAALRNAPVIGEEWFKAGAQYEHDYNNKEISLLKGALIDCIKRMTQAREILTKDQHDSWQMLNASKYEILTKS